MFIIEIIAVIAALVSVILTTKQNIWCWPIGMITIIGLFIVFWDAELYSNAVLRIIFMAQSIYGWYNWNRGKKNKIGKLPVSNIPKYKLLYETLIITVFCILFGWFLDAKTETLYPYLDSVLAGFSLQANWYITKKYIESWYIWLIA
ncbi:MAG: nicotinamide riboside transporter PnuC, partial [Candidatus Dadabacteria bacterium]|nr:nicotinamide riboside transporter PnuC [Candidatus Dadabacteria bacterium]